jgi:hypothetical protein
VNLNEQLYQLVEEACKHPPGSAARQKNLTRIVRLVSGKLWIENVPYYQDALQKTWLYFCNNVCEGRTGEPYDPNRSSVVTWLNYYLRRKLQQLYIQSKKQQERTVDGAVISSGWGEGQRIIDPIDNLSAQPEVPEILESVIRWAQTDADGELRNTYIKKHPQVNCQVLILKRLPPETSWKELSTEFGLSVSTLSSFYQRQCIPRLRKFGRSEGYI